MMGKKESETKIEGLRCLWQINLNWLNVYSWKYKSLEAMEKSNRSLMKLYKNLQNDSCPTYHENNTFIETNNGIL